MKRLAWILEVFGIRPTRTGQNISEAAGSASKAIWKSFQESILDDHEIVSEGTTPNPSDNSELWKLGEEEAEAFLGQEHFDQKQESVEKRDSTIDEFVQASLIVNKPGQEG
jgi:hypothetical protein